VELRVLQTKAGLRVVSWCTNPGCAEHRQAHPIVESYFFDAEDTDYSHLNLEQRFGTAYRCPCAVALVHTLCKSTADFARMLAELGPCGATFS
jgi:hypothetical protein